MRWIVIVFWLLLAVPGLVFAQGTAAPSAPPAPQVENPGVPPSSSAVWIAGRWAWQDGQFVWQSGRWETPAPGRAWVPGRWRRTSAGWVWEEGRWRP